MKISVITVCYNAVDTIEQTILSVIHQSYNPIEYIIVDGGSTDGTIDLINQYRNKIACFISEPDNGIYDAMNKGIMVATGEWINFMNAGDCFHHPDVCQSVINHIKGHPFIVYGNTKMRYNIGDLIMKPFPIDHLSWHMAFSHQSSFIRAAYQKEHLYSTHYRSSSDYDFFHRAYCNNVSFFYVDVTIADYEASYGLSSSSFLLVEKEMATINGKNRNMAWTISLYGRFGWYVLKQQVKSWLPSHAVLTVKSWKRKRNIA